MSHEQNIITQDNGQADIWQWQEPGTAWRGVGLYHITLTVPSREPLFGELVISDGDPTKARIERTKLGWEILEAQRHLSDFYPEIQILHYCLMPDHLHAVWYVKHPMPRGISYAVQGFWRTVKKIGRAYSWFSSFVPSGRRGNCQENFSSIAAAGSRNNPLRERLGDAAYYRLPSVFTEMPFIRPMGHRRQLPATIRYIDMNPQRLATKRLMPGYFRVQEGIEIGGRQYAGVGNAMLLQAERFAPVHVRRTMVEAAEHGEDKALRDYMNGCVLAARQGTVMVSPFISPKEKAVLDVLLQEGLSFIYLADNGFRDYYKPSDALFDACAAGQALILSPWEYNQEKRHISRADCVALNGMAEDICNHLHSSSSQLL